MNAVRRECSADCVVSPHRPLMPKNVHVETTRAALVLEKLSVVDVASIDPRRKYCVEGAWWLVFA